MVEHRKSRGALVVILSALALLPVVYFLSAGPVIRFCPDVNIINNYLFPLNTCIKLCPPLSKPANWYIQWWLPLDPAEPER